MKKVAFLLIILILLTAICGAFSACNGGADRENVIVVGTTMQVENAVRDEYNYDCIATATSEIPLVSKDENGNYSPLAVSYQTDDFKTWTLTVTDGLTWSDGTPVTANDIVFSYAYEGTAEKPAFSTDTTVGTFKNFTLSSDKKSVTLVRENAGITALDEMAVFRIRPKHVYENKDISSLTADDKRVSCGPYVFSSFDKASSAITFVKNPYYPTTPKVDKIVYKIFANDDVAYTALLGGELDFVWNYSKSVPVDYRNALAKSDKIALDSVSALNCPAVLVFNNSDGLGADKNVRHAIAHALDYAKFKEYFGSELSSTPNKSFVTSAHKGYKDTEKLSTDLEKGAEYMEKAGYTKVGGSWQKDGKTASLTLTVNGGNVTHVGYAEFVKTQLDNFGISVNLDVVDKAHFNEKTSHKYANEGSHGYKKITMESAIMGYTAAGISGDFGTKYVDGNHPVQGGAEVFSERLSALKQALLSATSETEYEKIAGEIQDFYASELPVISLYNDSMIYARSAKLQDVVLDGNFGLNNANMWFNISKQ